MFEDISTESLIALVTAIVAVFGLLFTVIRSILDARLARLHSQYQAKQLIRQAQLDVTIEIMDIVGRFITPEDEEQWNRDWHDFASIYTGRANLLAGSEFRKLMTEFGDYIWERDFKYFNNLEGKKFEEFESVARQLGARLNSSLHEQFRFEGGKPATLGARKARPRKSDS